MGKLISANQAMDLLKDGDTICIGGFVGCMHPEELTKTLEEKFLAQGHPKDLTLIFAAGQGDGKERGLNHLGHEGLVKRAIGGHWALAPKLQKLAIDNKIEAYNLPQGVICHLLRDIAAGKPGTLTHVGLHTFVDPRMDGGKINEKTKENIVSTIKIKDKDYLFYQGFPIDVAFIRASYADENGNASFEKEAVSLEMLAICQAVKNSGGKVILQVEKLVKEGTLQRRLVKIPGILVDAIVVAKPENHMQTFATQYNPAMSGEVVEPVEKLQPMDFGVRKIICRRAAQEVREGDITNLGIGIPEGIANILATEEQDKKITLTVESGAIGGTPMGGNDFGATINPDCIIDSPSQFDFYAGGGLDIAFLGLAQTDEEGNINVSKFGSKLAGCGGFIDITQNAKKVVYCGTFTADGLKIHVENQKLSITTEGKIRKFLSKVEHLTFSGAYAMEKNQSVLYITERAVFSLTKDGVTLIEIAPGIDLEKDILAHMDFKPNISENLKWMNSELFQA